MRLMTSEKGTETPLDKYARFKSNIKLWYQEMDREGLTKQEQKVLEPYFLPSYGVPPSQEQLMLMLMDKDICGFTLKESNAARKVVAKKLMSKIPALKQQIFDKASSPAMGEYIWKYGVGTQIGYSFARVHAAAYSYIGLQTVYIATNWNPIYWNTACLIVNSASLDDDDEEEEDIIDGTDNEDEDDEEKTDKKKTKTSDYSKVAKALGDIISRGIKVSLLDINKSSYTFIPDEKNNTILFGLKGVSKVNDSAIDLVLAGRPYSGIKDFMNRCKLKKPVMISLIKAGAFDAIDNDWASAIYPDDPRRAIMIYYISQICEMKKRLTLQNFNGLCQKGLLPSDMSFYQDLFVFNKNLKGAKYCITDTFENEFFYQNFGSELLSLDDKGKAYVDSKKWEKLYKKQMEDVKIWLKNNYDEILLKFNSIIFHEVWENSAEGNVSAWEMESVSFYFHEHELAHINNAKYGISNFNDLPREPLVDSYFRRNGHDIPLYKLTRIAGTVIGKNDTRSSISLLTTCGVVNVKFTKEYYAAFKRRLSEIQSDGTKKVIEQGWFTKGTKLMITGMRRDDTFVAKRYARTPGHQLYKIVAVNGEDITLEHERAKVNE